MEEMGGAAEKRRIRPFRVVQNKTLTSAKEIEVVVVWDAADKGIDPASLVESNSAQLLQNARIY